MAKNPFKTGQNSRDFFGTCFGSQFWSCKLVKFKVNIAEDFKRAAFRKIQLGFINLVGAIKFAETWKSWYPQASGQGVRFIRFRAVCGKRQRRQPRTARYGVLHWRLFARHAADAAEYGNT